MRLPARLALLSIALAVPAFSAARLTYMIHGTPVPVSWTSFPVNYAVDKRVADAIPVAQIDRATSEWANVAGAQISFRDTGVVDGLKAGKDGQNTITIADDLFANQKFIALTTNWYDDDGHVTEADIQIDPMAISGRYNLAQLIEHETGHLLGLDHSAVLSSVMYPYVGTAGVTTLDSDDRVAIATIYPKPSAPAGATLQGRVSGDDGGIFAAQVAAISDDGQLVGTALTGPDGSFTLQGVPSGNYRVYAEPLDGPVNVSNLSGTWRMAKVTSFPTEFADGGTSIHVDSGKIYGNIDVNGAGAVQLNPKWIGASGVDGVGVTLASMPVVTHPGQMVTISVGGDGFLSGVTTFEIPGNAFKRVSDFSWSGNYVAATFDIRLDTEPGSFVVLVHNNAESAALTGALRVEPRSRTRAVASK